MKQHVLPIAVALLIAFALSNCSKEDAARDTVNSLLKGMKTDTVTADYLAALLDLDELVKENSIYTYDSSLSSEQNENNLLGLLLPGGSVRDNWISKQIVLGSSKQLRDTATVEVSFIDTESRPVKQYYNKMGVRRVDGTWKVFAFKLFSKVWIVKCCS